MSPSERRREAIDDLDVLLASLPPEVHHDLDQRLAVVEGVNSVDDLRRQGREQCVEVVDRFPLAVLGSHADLHVSLGHRTPAGTRAGSATRTRVSFISSTTLAIESKPASSILRSIGDS